MAIGAFAIAWLALVVATRWLFGSGNVLVWVLAAAIGAAVYVVASRRDRRNSQRRHGGLEET